MVLNQLSLGATWQTGERGALSFFCSHAFSKTVDGQQSIPQPFGSGEANIKLRKDSLGFADGWEI